MSEIRFTLQTSWKRPRNVHSLYTKKSLLKGNVNIFQFISKMILCFFRTIIQLFNYWRVYMFSSGVKSKRLFYRKSQCASVIKQANQNPKQIHETGAKLGKTRRSKGPLVLSLTLIGGECWNSCWNQSAEYGDTKQNNRVIRVAIHIAHMNCTWVFAIKLFKKCCLVLAQGVTEASWADID